MCRIGLYIEEKVRNFGRERERESKRERERYKRNGEGYTVYATEKKIGNASH